MKLFSIHPEVHTFDSAAQFCAEMQIGKGDLVISNAYILHPAFDGALQGADVLFQEKYGTGEPSDRLVENMAKELKGPYRRVFGIGGGSVIDVAKLFALKNILPIVDLFDGKIEPVKDKQLIIVPTTCGTGSEMTNLSILALASRGTKLGFPCDAIRADQAVLIPQLLDSLPFYVFATSSLDALIHAVEASLSPRANDFTQLMAQRAIALIVNGYQEVVRGGDDARRPLHADFLLASNYAGIALSVSGAGAVHAMSYPIGGNYHVPHGESNYALFTAVLERYHAMAPDGGIARLETLLSQLLECPQSEVYAAFTLLLDKILKRKPLREYGVAESDLPALAENVVRTQQRLLSNNYAPFTQTDILAIYQSLY